MIFKKNNALLILKISVCLCIYEFNSQCINNIKYKCYVSFALFFYQFLDNGTICQTKMQEMINWLLKIMYL